MAGYGTGIETAVAGPRGGGGRQRGIGILANLGGGGTVGVKVCDFLSCLISLLID